MCLISQTSSVLSSSHEAQSHHLSIYNQTHRNFASSKRNNKRGRSNNKSPHNDENAPLLNEHLIAELFNQMNTVKGGGGGSGGDGVAKISADTFEVRLIVDAGRGKKGSSSNDDNNTSNGTDGIKGGDHSVINMTKNVRWKYVPGTAPTFPLVLKPNEAFATVIEIHASEVMVQRTFISPISLHAVVSHKDLSNIKPSCFNEAISRESEASDSLRDEHRGDMSHVIVTADVKWSTCAITDGPTDAFHINLEVDDSTCQVGEQFTVSLKITNLS